MFRVEINQYHIVLLKDAEKITSSENSEDFYSLEMDVKSIDNKFKTKLKILYHDVERKYRNALIANSKWIMHCYGNLDTGIIKLFHYEDSNDQIKNLGINPDEDDIETVII